MFHGGTNFGFMNGANVIVANNIQVFPYYAPDVTSYGMLNCQSSCLVCGVLNQDQSKSFPRKKTETRSNLKVDLIFLLTGPDI
jgi:hypothetical protein